MNPLVLIILDGWGSSAIEKGNAILQTPTPNFDQLLSYFPHSTISASGEAVGLEWGEMGNSEVGHLNFGTGRIIQQDLPRIDKSINDGTFFSNHELLGAFNFVQKNNSNLHLVGLTSYGGVHSSLKHLYALLNLAKQKNIKNVFIHCITDGRDTKPRVAINDLAEIEKFCREVGLGKIATIMGRYYAMDRDKHWDRIQTAYEALFDPNFKNQSPDSVSAIKNAYLHNQSDEFITPTVITNTARINDNDALIFFNFRSDRIRQLSDSIINNDFQKFSRKNILNNFYFVSFTSYGFEPTPNVKVAFFAEKVSNCLSRVISQNNLKQLHLAETEKFAHVTYFFNAGEQKPFPGENHILVKSPQVPTYDLAPEMSAEEIYNQFANYFIQSKPAFTVINFANPDMVGHTGVWQATLQAVYSTDKFLGKIANIVLTNNANLIVTADHGNAEEKIDENNQPSKEHTTNPVPLILALPQKRLVQSKEISLDYKIKLASQNPIGVLADVTATSLELLGLQKPDEMSGQSLVGQF